MLLPIDSIREHPHNARAIAASAEADEALKESLRTLGLIQPIVVVPIMDHEFAEVGEEDRPVAWELRAGSRRLRAAKALGWQEIPASEWTPHDVASDIAISAAENMVRSAMHPVDQWRAIRDLRASSGYSLETAAAAIGVGPATARRMEWLAGMAPDVLDAMGQSDMPATMYLRALALATHEQQRAAIEHARTQAPGKPIGETFIDWRIAAERCTVRRIPRSRALFDPTLMSWDEDLFGEADDEDRFTSADVDAFLGHQREALDALITKHKGRWIAFTQEPGNYYASLPKGWAEDYAAIPKRFAKDDPRKVFVTISTRPHTFGALETHLARPTRRESVDVNAHDRAKPSERPAIAKRTLQQLARLKAEAVRSKLLEVKHKGAAAMLEALLLVFTFENVQAGGIAGSPRGSIARLVSPEGVVRADCSEADLCDAAAWLISAVISFDAPDVTRSSGPGAEWLAMTIGAQMPRTDTLDILSGINGDELRLIAAQHNIVSRGAVGTLRQRLVGLLPDWRAVQFGAPGLKIADEPDEPGEASEDAISWPDVSEEDAA